MINRICITVASALGAGFAPFAPGTWGSLVASVFFLLAYYIGWDQTGWPLLLLTLVLSVIAHQCIIRLPENWIHDDQRIVIDEVLGVMVTMLFIPLNGKTIFLSLVLFRIFDIWKPLGIRRFDHLHSDWSVIVDDLLAGVYANLTLRGLVVLLSAYGLW